MNEEDQFITKNPEEEKRNSSDLEVHVQEIKELAKELKLEPQDSILKKDSHFWFLVTMKFDSQRKNIVKIFDDSRIPILTGVENLEALDDLYNRLALNSAIEITRASDIDQLTGAWKRDNLINRITFFQTLIKENIMDSDYLIILHFIDLDNFKQINDTLGHGVGDEVLKAFVKSAIETLRVEDSIFRYGGEEFCVLQLINKNSLQKTAQRAEISTEQILKMISESSKKRIVEATKNRLLKIGFKIDVDFSVGVTEIKPDQNPKEAISKADDLMYQAKRKGKGRVEAQFNSTQPLIDNVKKIMQGK